MEKVRQFCLGCLRRLVGWLEPKALEENTEINSLIPRVLREQEDIHRVRPYLDALKSAIDKKDITNIALTGTYGAGKSTVIRTFQHLNKGYKYLNVSLASFKANKKDDDLERKLEISILQQMFYHVKPSKIPDSRFKRIVNIKPGKLFVITTAIVLWIMSAIILFKFGHIERLSPRVWSFNDKFDWLSFVFILIFFLGLGVFIRSAFRLLRNSKINKLNIKGELELGSNIDKSIFNEHLEEILYFFERTDYDVVVIEDLDRFNSTDIFTKLREINILLNSSELIGRDINFLYAVRDEVFKDKNERVKFFDFIIPVIPFINPSNAGEQLTKLIKRANLEGVLSKVFTEDIVTFIDDIDMRLLINIFHEYCLYRENLSKDLSQDNLFAMVVYKNMYPEDFGRLHKRQGNLYRFLSNKENYIKDLLETIDKQIQEKKAKIEEIEKERIESVDELRAIYINAIHQAIPEALYVLDDKIAFNKLIHDENFEKLKNSVKIGYFFYLTPYRRIEFYQSDLSFPDIERKVNPNFSYEDRVRIISDKNSGKIELLKQDIETLRARRSEIEFWSLREIFEEMDVTSYLGDFSNNLLIRNLLLNGYIDENYCDYISLFHGVNMTKEDYAFERRVRSGVSSPFEYKLKEIGVLVRKLPKKYFRSGAILNFDLLNFLSEHHEDYEAEYKDVLSLLGNEKERSCNFIDGYVEAGKHLGLFIRSLYGLWSGFWAFIYNRSSYTRDKKIKYLQLIIENVEVDDIVSCQEIGQFINTLPNFLSLVEGVDKHKVRMILKRFDIKFESLEMPSETSKDLLDYIYENCFYQINIKNLDLMLHIYNQGVDMENIEKKNYTTILNSRCEPLKKYIDGNIDKYVNNVMLQLPDNNKEEENNVLALLNRDSLQENLKLALIKKQHTIVGDLSKVNGLDIQKCLIDNEKILVCWNNVYAYYERLPENVLDEVLINYLNKESVYKELARCALTEDEFVEAFFEELISCNELEYDSFINLMKNVSYEWECLDFECLDKKRVLWMINEGMIAFTEDNFDGLKEFFPGLHIVFLEKYFQEFTSESGSFSLDEKDSLALLNSAEIDEDGKRGLIGRFEDDLIIENEDIRRKVCNLLADYGRVVLSDEVLESIFRCSCPVPDKIKLLNTHFDGLNDRKVQALIEMLGEDYLRIFKAQNKPTFANTTYHVQLFKNLQKRNLIKRYEDIKEDKLRVIANY